MLSHPRGRGSRATGPLPRRLWARSIFIAALTCAVAAPAAARPLGQPYQLGLTGHPAHVVFNDRDGRFLLSTIRTGHGLSIAVDLADVGTSGAPGERSFPSLGSVAFSTDLAFDARRDRYLVVYSDSPDDNLTGGFGIYGELRAADGHSLAGRVMLTPAYGDTAVAYDRRRDQYLLVVAASRGPSRVVGSLLGADLRPLGAPFAISDRPEVIAHRQPEVVYRPAARDFVVTWVGERADRSAGAFAQRISAAGGKLGPDNVDVSAGGGAPPVLSQSLAASAHDPGAAVAWADAAGVHVRRMGERLSLGAERTISGPDNHPLVVRLTSPQRSTAIAYQPLAREWLVAWSGTGPESPIDTAGQQVESVFGQHLSDRRLRERGPDDFPISETVAPDLFHAQSSPDLAADSTSRKYLAAWSVDFYDTAGQVRIFMRRIAAEPPRR